jgi:putative ABC transport system permease protein
MSVLMRLTLRNLSLNRKRTIVTVIGIILSGAMICGVSSLVASFQDLLVQSAKLTDGDYHASYYEVPYKDSKYITDNAYTETSMLSKDLGFARLAGSKNPNKPYLMIKSYDATAFTHMPIQLTEGRFPEKAGEIVVSQEVFYSGGVEMRIGDTFALEVGQRVDNEVFLDQQRLTETETLEQTKDTAYTVTGLIEQPRFEAFDSPGFTAIEYLDASGLSAEDRVNVSIVAKNPKRIFERGPELAEAAGAANIIYNKELLKWQGITQNDRVNTMFRSLQLIIISLVVVGSVSVIYNAFAISVSERKKQFGMLSSVGATGRQIRRMVFFEGFVLGLIGIPFGILSGLAGIWATLKVVNRLGVETMFPHALALRLIVSPEIVLITVFFLALTIFLSAYIPAKRAARISPVEAIRLNTDINIKAGKLRTSRLTRRLFGIEGELALKNLKRNRRRYRATVFSLFISIVLYVTFSSFMTYGFKSSGMYYSDIPFDFSVEKQQLPMEELLAFYTQVAELPQVERMAIVQRIFNIAGDLGSEKIGSYVLKNNPDAAHALGVSIIAVGEKEFAKYAHQLGLDASEYRNTKDLKGILVNLNKIREPVIAEFTPLQVQPGETFELRDTSGDEDAEPFKYSIEIGAVTDQLPFGTEYAGIGNVNVIVSDDIYRHVLQQLSANSSQYADNARLFLNVKDETDRRAFEKEIKDIDARLHPGPYLSVYDSKQMKEEMNRTKTIMSIFLYGFVSLITLIGVTNIFNTISTNVALRRREFAMLKSVGLTPSGFNMMINYESIFYGLKSLLYGLPVSILISIWMYRSIGDIFQFAFILPWKEMLICIAGVFVIVFITMMHASSKLKKENIIDALKEENL